MRRLGHDTGRSSNASFQPKRFTSYERDGNQSDEAMHRRYNGFHSRFDQPDPYEGSYDPTNPQSFNRYSYVENDPVNFVDPSGLLRIQQCTRDWMSVGGEKIYGAPYNCKTIYDEDGGSGGGGGAATPKNTEPVQNNKSDCAKFVDNLVSRTEGTAPLKATAANVGRQMGYAARNTFSRNSKSLGISGFRDELVRPNQLGDVYKHILGHAGATLIGNAKLYGWGGGRTGNQISQDEEAIDRRQLNDPAHRREAEVELRDNAAGRTVGNLMRSRIYNDISRADLSRQLMDTLCAF